MNSVAERFAALGFGCDVWTDPPGQVWADFVHDADEIVMLIKGEIEVSFAGKTVHPRARNSIPAGASHPGRRSRAGPVRFWLRVGPKGIEDKMLP